MQGQIHMDIEDLLGAYALDSVDNDERRAVEDHLSACVDCRRELRNHREVTALLAGQTVHPPARVWERIVAEIADETPDQVPGPVISLERRRRARALSSTRWVASVAAAVI